MICPICRVAMQKTSFGSHAVHECPDCGGIWCDGKKLQGMIDGLLPIINGLSIHEALHRKVVPMDNSKQSARICPKCGGDMAVFNYAYDSNVFLDRCKSCGGIWADRSEIEEIARFNKSNPSVDKYAIMALSQARKALSQEKEKIAEIPQRAAAVNRFLGISGMRTLMLTWPLFPIPVRSYLPTKSISLATICLIGINTFIFVLFGQETFVHKWGLVPSLALSPARAFSFITSVFMHASWFHFLVNMSGLWFFGNNIEDEIGKAKFIVLYLVCGIAGGIVFCAIHPALTVPAIGASGAVSGLMGAYLILFPTADLMVLWMGRVRIIYAAVYLLLWILLQLLSGIVILKETPDVNIAYWAHIGGFVSGFVLIWFLRRGRTSLYS